MSWKDTDFMSPSPACSDGLNLLMGALALSRSDVFVSLRRLRMFARTQTETHEEKNKTGLEDVCSSGELQESHEGTVPH